MNRKDRKKQQKQKARQDRLRQEKHLRQTTGGTAPMWVDYGSFRAAAFG